MIYKWKTGYFKTSAETAGKVFSELEQTVGLTAKTVVDASRAKDAPLHNEFEWNNKIAGELWREEQARTMIQNLVVQIDDNPDTPPTRAFVKLEQQAVYEDVRTVLADVQKTTSLLQMALKELTQFQRKYSDLKELAGVFQEVEKVKQLKETA